MRHNRRHIGRRAQRGFFSRIAYALRERQIYLRSEGEVQFITLRPWVQAAVLLAFSIGMFWVAYATVNVAFKDQVLALKERNQYRARLEYEDRIGQMRATIDKLNRRLMLDQRAYLAKVDQVRSEHDRLVDRHEQLAEFFHSGWLPERSNGAQQAEPQKQGSLLPRGSIGTGNYDSEPDKQVPPFASDAYRAEFASAEQALQPLADLRAYMSRMEQREATLIGEAAGFMETEAGRLAEVYRKLGINADKLVANSSYEPAAVGGPFIAATAGELESQLIADEVQNLSQNINRWETLKYQAIRLPVARPMGSEHETTSGFGLRKDPFRKRAAMHAGIDFRGATGSDVKAAGPGKVTKAGRAGGYGKMVEIRHENGVSTRYGHLSIINVRAGQNVSTGDIIGKVGSTGRSTGPHLHYETRVGGRAIDPVKFWKARDVFQEITR